MVGKPNFPDDVDGRDDLKGSSTGTPGLTALDEEREASLADEGGASGAAVETQDPDSPLCPTRDVKSARPHAATDACARGGARLGLVAAVGVAAAISAIAYHRWRH